MATQPAQKGNPLEQLVPLLMLAAPLVELAKPGAGVGVYHGALQHQERTKARNQALVFSLAKDLGNVDDENLPMVKEALKAQGLSPEHIEAAISLSKVYRDPNARARKQLEQIITEEVPGLGSITGTRAHVQDVRIGQARHAQGVQERAGIRQEEALSEQQRAASGFATRTHERQETAATGRINEVQQVISRVMLDPRVSPQIRARALALYRLSQRPDADAETLAANAEPILTQAATEIGQAPKTVTPPNVVERVRQKIAAGQKLTPGEQEIKRQEIDRAPDRSGAAADRAVAGEDRRATRAEETALKVLRAKTNAARKRASSLRAAAEKLDGGSAKRAAEREANQAEANADALAAELETREADRPRTSEQRPAGGFDQLTPATAQQHPGVTIKDTKTGKRFRSDGKKWVPVP